MTLLPRILITPGEPAGIGPDITLMAAGEAWPAELIVTGDMACLAARAKALGLPTQLTEWRPGLPAAPHTPHHLNVLSVPLAATCTPGKPHPANAAQVLRCLEIASTLCTDGQATALVTGPVHKALLDASGTPFTGHTEYLATLTQSPQPVMLFVSPTLRVALLTTHLPLAEVPAAITTERLEAVLTVLYRGLQTHFDLSAPQIVVCGLNPHAGEEGLLGTEEQRILIPTLQRLREQGMRLIGPVAADTAFTQERLPLADAVLAMYHDQALPVVKSMDFGHAVNVTLGLPWLRTSVDHGVAFDAAGNGKADVRSLRAAIQQAISLTGKSRA